MGSFTDQTTCPQCRGAAVREFDTRDGHTHEFCLRCGRVHDRPPTDPHGAVQDGHGTILTRVRDGGSIIRSITPGLSRQAVLADLTTWSQHHPTLSLLGVRLPPAYRLEFITGTPMTAAPGPSLEQMHVERLRFLLEGSDEYLAHTNPTHAYVAHLHEPGYRVLTHGPDGADLWLSCSDLGDPPLALSALTPASLKALLDRA